MFKKFPSIENSYREKIINMFLKNYSEIKDIRYIIQHKYDGCNISLIFHPNGDFEIASRNRIVEPDENFFDVWNVIKRPEYKELLDYGHFLAKENDKIIQIFGELFGNGIQKRIDYGPDKYFRIFDVVSIDEKQDDVYFWSQYYIYTDHILSKYMVEIFNIIDGLENALNYKPLIFEDIEGVVIKPYFNVYFSPQGSIFYLKNKNPKFEEKGSKKSKNDKPKFDSDVEKLRDEFSKYINENRVLSIFSKCGEINDPKQIGNYIRLILEDAKDDFFKDGHIVSERDSKEIKYIFNVGSSIVEILNKYL